MTRRLTALFLLLASAALAADVPAAPKGFAWRQVPAIKASFLVPDGWHFSEERRGKTLGLFITKDEIKAGGGFEIGVTINAFLDDPGAPAKVKKILDGMAAKYSSKVSPGSSEPFASLTCQFDSPRQGGKEPVRTFMVAIANPKTRTAYLVLFESPVSQWSETWPAGNAVLNNLALETEI
jgi:hypothetical protein